ncbi:MAG: hypothetical protein JNL01_01525 [Bdellovibrionales bacterium]|nr:hypothetical protein [Bdellovibrionales bacterium]
MLRLLESLTAFFGVIHVFTTLALGVVTMRALGSLSLAGLVGAAWLYLFPPILWRIVRVFTGNPVGAFRVGKTGKPSAWVAYYNLQFLFTVAPWIEKFLLLIPGAYSAWLRLWGSQIGKKVIWTPGVTIVDRGHLEVGDYAFFGNNSYLSAHVVSRRDTRYILYVKKLRVGNRAFVGAWSMLGPGAKVQDHGYTEIHSAIYEDRTGVQNETKVH